MSGGNSKFAINASTGQVTLANALDYESATSHTFSVTATAGGESETSNFTLNVDNHTYTVSDSAAHTGRINPSSNVTKGTYYRTPSSNYTYLLDEDIVSKGASDRVVGDFGTGVAGTTYTLGGTNHANFTVDSAGILSIKNYTGGPGSANPIIINEGNVQNTGTLNVSVTANIPGEGQVASPSIYVKGKNVESNENLVLKFASGYNNVDHNLNTPFKATAHRNASGSGGHNNQVVTESVLSIADQASSPHINSANDEFYTRYGQSSGESYYRTSTVANGDNEHGTEILDFEYWFPIDSDTSIGRTIARQYAPMSEANAGWDAARPAREEAKYACLDSGQGCGGGTTEHALSGNWTATTEGSNFSGYKVTQRNFNRSADNLLNANADGSSVRDGSGTHTLLGEYSTGFGGYSNNYPSEFEIVALPETFKYFGQSFSHIYVNENGFLTFGNSGTDKPWHQVNFSPHPSAGGGVPLMYLHESNAYTSYGNHRPDSYPIPEVYGLPGSQYEDNLDNTIFALWNDYYTDANSNDWSIRQLWNSTTKILTIGWYNVTSYSSRNYSAEANFEVQLDFNDDSFRIVHGDFGSNFPADNGNNAFVGISKDVSCATSAEDISMCEGKDYIQLYFHDNHFGRYESPTSNKFNTFQNPNTDDTPANINHMTNYYLTNSQTVNGTQYCYTNDNNLSSTSCTSTYSNTAGNHFTFAPQGGTGAVKNVLLPSNIKQSYRSGLMAEFMWMHLDKDPTTLTYTPPANNATGFDAAGPNSRDGVSGGSLSAGSAISHTTALDEIVIAGEVYTHKKLQSFLHNNVTGYSKKVVAYAPIPLLHTNKYELTQYAGQSDVRFRRARLNRTSDCPAYCVNSYLLVCNKGMGA